MIVKPSFLLILAGLLLAASVGCHHYGFPAGSLQKSGLLSKGAVQKGASPAKGSFVKGCKGGCEGPCRCGLLSAFHGCGTGCGEVYWGEWLHDPPDCCDPCCECYGVYTGPRDDCRRVIIDPLLWLFAVKHKHCRAPWEGAPCSYGYDCDGGCGCGGCQGGGYGGFAAEAYQPYGDYRCNSPGCGGGVASEGNDDIPTPTLLGSRRIHPAR